MIAVPVVKTSYVEDVRVRTILRGNGGNIFPVAMELLG